jgi:hypothetical protein
MCLGCPNQASYTARTWGGGPDTLWFGPALRRDAEWEHPWVRERRKSKAAAARETIIQSHLKAACRCLRFRDTSREGLEVLR